MKAVVWVVPCFFAGVLVSAEPLRSADVSDSTAAKRGGPSIQLGESLLGKDDYSAAVRAFNDALRIDPRCVPAYIGRGTAERLLENFDGALADFNEALRLDPKNSEAHRERGCVHFQMKDFAKAMADFDVAIRCDPKNAAAYYWRGILHAHEHESLEAISDYDRAIRLNPGDAWAYYNRGLEEVARKETGKAIADFSECLRISPRHYLALCNRGVLYRDIDKPDKALNDFSAAIRLDPGKTWPLVVRSGIYNKLGEFAKEAADLSAAIRIDPNSADLYSLRALNYESKGDTRRAEDDCAQAGQLRLQTVLSKSGLAKAQASPNTLRRVETRIHEEVKQLEYADAVADELAAMVRPWNLAALAEKLNAAMDKGRRGMISKDERAGAEREVADLLCQEICVVVRGKEARELDEVIRSRSACCVGYALVFDVLGRAIGLEVQGLEVPLSACGNTVDGNRHMACLVRLADGRSVIADAANVLGHNSLVSKPFTLTETYRREGSYWRLNDARKSPGLHQVIQPVDNQGFVAEILVSRAVAASTGNDSERARSLADDAVRRNPKDAHILTMRGMILAKAGEKERAIADFNVAIQQNPSYPIAYLKRGLLRCTEYRFDEGFADLDQAIHLNPKCACARAARGVARWEHAKTIWAAFQPSSDSPSSDPGESSPILDTKIDRAADFEANKDISAFLREAKTKDEVAAGRVLNRDLEDARKDIGDAICLDPKDPTYYKWRASLQQDSDKAIADLGEAIRINPKDGEAYEARAKLYTENHEIEKAKADFAQATRLRPDDDLRR
jgi:tetratricopeptide (TPR) repeat protein